MNKQERSEKISEYGRGFDVLEAALAGVPREAWSFKPAAGDWSINEVIQHMADSEMIGVTRLHKLIAEPGSTVMPYDDAKWARALHYQDQSTEDALQLFRLLRQRTYALLKSLPDHLFANTVVHPENVHPEFGDVFNVDKWLHIYAWHGGDHVEQIEKNHKAWQAQRQPRD